MANTKLKSAPVDEDEDLDDLVDDLDDEDEDEAPVVKTKKAKPVEVVDDDEEMDEDNDVVDAPAPVAVVRKMPIAKPARPVVVSPPPGDEDVSDTEFDKEAKKRKDAQKVNDYLERKRSDETVSVDEMTELMMLGDTDKIMRELVSYCADNSGIKTAKQLLREARDRAKARITRIAGVVGVMLDDLKTESEDGGNRD